MLSLILATEGSWWARYTPYLYLLPIFNIIFLLNEKHILNKIIGYILVILLITNMSFILYANCTKNFVRYTTIKNELKNFKDYVKTQEYVDVKLKTDGHEGLKYNIIDLKIDEEKIKYTNKLSKPYNNAYFWSYNRSKDNIAK